MTFFRRLLAQLVEQGSLPRNLTNRVGSDYRMHPVDISPYEITRRKNLASHIAGDCVNSFGPYLKADVPCQKLTEELEALYFVLAFCFYTNNLVTLLDLGSKSAKKREVVFVEIWRRVVDVVDTVLGSYADPNYSRCGFSVKRCLCMDRLVVLWRIVYL